MPSRNVSGPGSTSFNIPVNGFNIRATVRGARGGRGGEDAEANGGEGGSGISQSFQWKSSRNFIARNFSITAGGRGGNGQDNQPNATGGSGGGGVGGGGRGGNAGDPPYSGGGGGGGGGSAVYDGGTLVIVMGGSGGGGGASDDANGGDGGVAGTNASGVGSVSSGSGSGGGDPGGTDGGGGGGGGGGASGGGGGRAGRDKNWGGGGGGAGSSQYKSSYLNAGGSSGSNSRDGYVQVDWDEATAQVNSFTAVPKNQNSTAGTPAYNTQLQWQTTYANNVSITSSAGESWSFSADMLGSTGSLDITNLPQSNADGNSPASRQYTLVASNGANQRSRNVTVNARNDNTPSNSWTTSFTNQEPNSVVTLNIGTIGGVDMSTTVSTTGAGNFIGSGGSFSGSRTFNNGNTVQLRTTTLPFNTNTSGLTGNFGNTNTKTVSISYPGGSQNITITTRAPRINEVFDYADNKDKYPYEDIDLIANSPTEHLATAQINVDDIEIPMEMKVSRPQAQISVNGGGWQNVRST